LHDHADCGCAALVQIVAEDERRAAELFRVLFG